MTSSPRLRGFYGDAMTHQTEDITTLVRLYAMIGRIRLISDRAVIDAAVRVGDAIIETYLGPNHTLHEMIGHVQSGALDVLSDFSEACRKDLAAHATAVR